ncbi:MAG: GHKL domain-containing protein, partial [Desulfamplus sp.]|nr:GHKL domain-containing protein [Desulfamplus sp.]
LNFKHVQKMVERKNKLLEKTLSYLQSAQKKLIQSEKMAALGVLTAGIAHEINNPVNFIKTSAIGLEQDIKDIERLLSFYKENCSRCNHNNNATKASLESIKKDIEFDILIKELPQLMHNIKEGVNRTQEIVSSLRLYSRMDDFDFKQTNIHSLLDSALVILKNRYYKKIEVTKAYGEIPIIYGNAGKLIQVFTNIITNAIDALQSIERDKKRITIRTYLELREDIEYIAVEIKDNGPGIKQSHIDKIFDPFFTTKDVGKGSGLGLSISNGIISEHNGIIEVTTKPESGTLFSIFLPVKEEHHEK